MNKICFYALIFLLLLFLVFFADYQKLRKEVMQKNSPLENNTINNSQPQAIEEKDMRELLKKYLQSDLEDVDSPHDSIVVNQFLPDIIPIENIVISQNFTELHNGIDLAAASGESVIATAAGKIVKAGYDDYFGNLVVIDHLNGYSSFYGHLSKIYVKENYFAEKGMQIGAVGSTGFSTGPHLHYSISNNSIFIDPETLWTN